MLQSCFVGKVAEAYSAPSSEHSSDYGIVKKDILKAYELVPEAYRHKIRAYKKYESQTYATISTFSSRISSPKMLVSTNLSMTSISK
jgi:hypothetical protein